MHTTLLKEGSATTVTLTPGPIEEEAALFQPLTPGLSLTVSVHSSTCTTRTPGSVMTTTRLKVLSSQSWEYPRGGQPSSPDPEWLLCAAASESTPSKSQQFLAQLYRFQDPLVPHMTLLSLWTPSNTVLSHSNGTDRSTGSRPILQMTLAGVKW